jgi:hypothetical protein
MTAAFESTAFEATAFEVSSSAPVVVASTVVPAVAQLALDRLAQQFRDKPNIVSFVTAQATPAQSIEDALQQLLTLRSVYTATGSTLDAIGKLVNQPRNGLVDADYRRYIAARVRANSSDGIPDQLLAICRLVINNDMTSYTYKNIGIAAYEIIAKSGATGGAITDAIAAIVIAFLSSATAAGVRGVFRYDTDVNDIVFRFMPTCFASVAITAADTTITVVSTAGFPDAGSFDAEKGTASADVISYTGRTATTFTGCTGVSHNHVNGTALTQLASDAGFNTSGAFAGALRT